MRALANWPGRLLTSLRQRILISFILVSAVPVLLASYLAAQAISDTFQYNIERWLEEAVQFLAGETDESEEEADKSALIMATALEGRSMEALAGGQMRRLGDLLVTNGYEIVKIYRADGTEEFSASSFPLVPPPLQEQRSVYHVGASDSGALAVGAMRSFRDGAGNRHFVLVADLIDDDFFKLSKAITSFDVTVQRVEDGKLVAGGTSAHHNVPQSVLAALMAGAATAIAPISPDDDVATAFAPLRDHQGRLIGVVACRLASDAIGFESLSQWRLFLALTAMAALFSLAVGAFIASRVSRPVRRLTLGVREVSAGRYGARVAEEGGAELEELAAGFNAMTTQLERLREMEDKMRRSQQFAALGEAATVIAHEIRNPLGIIKTSADIVRRQSALAPSEDRLLAFVLEEVARIDRLVQDIIDYVRPREPQIELLDLMSDVVCKVLAVSAPKLEQENVTVATLNVGLALPVRGDADQLHQVFLNLVLNAVDAMRPCGRLTVSGRRDGDMAEVLVEDDGSGMSPDVMTRIFDPFFTTKAQGAGLGLAKSRAIVEEHGGTLACRSEAGEGSVFVVRLPAVVLAAALPSDAAA